MLKQRLVLVLGAGASMDYGFPSTFQLKQDVLKGSRHMLNAVRAAGVDIANFQEEFRLALASAPAESIDAFLEHYPEFEGLGKACIAWALIQHEKPEKLAGALNHTNSWYHYLYWVLERDGFDHFADDQNLSIITFNYDRSLEHFLVTSLQYGFKKPKMQCVEKVKKYIPIIHVHGTLGEPPGFGKQPKDERVFLPEADADNVNIAMKQIRIVHEHRSQKEFQKAHELLDNAEIVWFLGFGYQKLNVERLELERAAEVRLDGTAYGFNHQEVGYFVKPSFPHHGNFSPRIDSTVLGFLRTELPPLAEPG